MRHRETYDAAQFPHVTGPWVVQEGGDGVVRKRGRVRIDKYRINMREVTQQQWNIFPALTKCGQVDVKPADSIVQVFTKQLLFDQF